MLADFVAATFNHDDRVLRARDDDVYVALLDLLDRWVGHELAIETTHADPADGAVPGKAAQVNGQARSRQSENVGLVLLVARHHGRHQLGFHFETISEQRTAGPVHDAAGQDLVISQTGFTLEESARDLAGGVRLLDVVAG